MLNKNDLEVVSWNWLILSGNDELNTGDTFHISTLLNPFVEQIEISELVENLCITINKVVPKTYVQLLGMFAKATNYPTKDFNLIEYIQSLLISREHRPVLILKGSDGRFNIRSFENLKIRRVVNTKTQVSYTFECDQIVDFFTNDLYGLDVIFHDDSILSIFHLIEETRTSTLRTLTDGHSL